MENKSIILESRDDEKILKNLFNKGEVIKTPKIKDEIEDLEDKLNFLKIKQKSKNYTYKFFKDNTEQILIATEDICAEEDLIYYSNREQGYIYISSLRTHFSEYQEKSMIFYYPENIESLETLIEISEEQYIKLLFINSRRFYFRRKRKND